MASAEGLKEVGYFDCAGGGQIRVDGTTAYIGHMANPFDTCVGVQASLVEGAMVEIDVTAVVDE